MEPGISGTRGLLTPVIARLSGDNSRVIRSQAHLKSGLRLDIEERLGA